MKHAVLVLGCTWIFWMVGLANEGTTIQLLPNGPEYQEAYDTKDDCLQALRRERDTRQRLASLAPPGSPHRLYRCLPLGIDPATALRAYEKP